MPGMAIRNWPLRYPFSNCPLLRRSFMLSSVARSGGKEITPDGKRSRRNAGKHSGALRRAAAVLGMLLGTCTLAAPSQAAMTAWVRTDHLQLRLLGAAIAADGTLPAAVDIALAPGWDTYWRTPGQGGVPPQ